MRRAADIVEGQLGNVEGSQILLRSLKRWKIGNDVGKFVTDFRHSNETGRVKRSVWGINGNAAERRYSNNTMGASQS
ncbi:unnamed protein product [Mycena citricolor]|uniref:Uncharacterized protein n=1 Tax=Mycena citricolor TaxID=2018698 RepID=A0AAD2HDM4_9AGAR|nr:unnamed protein product [Mycena citricolor]CAK5281308.1 unnamed protein product [Mycena citricolor]